MKNKEHSYLAKQLKGLQIRQYGYEIQIRQLKKDISWYILQQPDDAYGFDHTEYCTLLRSASIQTHFLLNHIYFV